MHALRTAAIGVTALVVLTACRTEKGADTAPAVTCDAPVADAGGDATITLGNAVTLDGGASRYCADREATLSYVWAFESVPTDSIIDSSALSDNQTASAAQPSFTPDVVGDYTLSLVLDDGTEISASNYVVVTVVSGDQKPVADCGHDIETRVGQSGQLDGSASYDPEGAALEYTWTVFDRPTCSGLTEGSIYNSAGPTPYIVPDCAGIFNVSLVVSDGVNYSAPSICTVEAVTENARPIASAGNSLDLGACADNPFALDGTGSYDPEADPLTYTWSLYAAPGDSTASDSNLDDPTAAAPSFAWDVPGTYTFQLQVNDGEWDSAPDLVSITIGETIDNRAPIANAGESQTIENEADCASSSYVWTCDDCSQVNVEVDGSASRDPDGDTLSYTWSESTGTVNFTARYSAISDAVVPAQPATYGTATSVTYDLTLSVADCEESDSDSVQITYSCEGEAP
jgi:hypothetical protein